MDRSRSREPSNSKSPSRAPMVHSTGRGGAGNIFAGEAPLPEEQLVGTGRDHEGAM
jgi:hypothetical protein